MASGSIKFTTNVDGRGFKSGLSGLESNAGSSTNRIGSMFKKLAITVGAVLSVQQVVTWGKALIKSADQYTSAMSRLNMMTGGSKKASEALYKSVTAAANRSRGSINDMMDTVGKLGIMAKGAFKGGNKEVVAFAEQINKLGVISGSTTQEMNAGMMQLQQSLASGKLQGDELRSVLENMPGVAKTLAQGLGVSTGELRKMGAEGKLTSDVVVEAIMRMKGQTDKDFNSMGWTFAQTWQVFKNKATEALQPAYKELSKFANSADFKSGMEALAKLVGQLAGKLVVAIKYTVQLYKALEAHPKLLRAIATALGVVAAGFMTLKLAKHIVSFIRLGKTIAETCSLVTSFADVVDVLEMGLEGGVSALFRSIGLEASFSAASIASFAGAVGIAGSALAVAVVGIRGYIKEQQEADAALGHVKEKTDNLVSSTNALIAAKQNAQATYATSIASAQAEGQTAYALNDQLQKLVETQGTTAAGKQRISDLVTQLNQKVPGLNLQYDTMANKLSLTNTQIKDHIANMIQEAKTAAMVQILTETYKQQYEQQAKISQIENQMTANKSKANSLMAEYNRLMNNGGYAQHAARLGQIRTQAQKLDASQKELAKSHKKLDKSMSDNEISSKAWERVLSGDAKSYKSAVAQVKKELANVPGKAKSAGKNTKSGFEKGISIKGWHNMGVGAGGGFLKGLKKALHIKSPSRETMAIAKFAYQGFDQGAPVSIWTAIGSQSGEGYLSGLSGAIKNSNTLAANALPPPNTSGAASAASANASTTISGGMAASIDAVKNQQAPMDTAAKSVFETLPKNANDKSQKAKTQVTEQLIATSNWVGAAYPAQLSQSARSAFDRVRAQAADRTMAAKQSSIRTLLSTTQWMVTTGRVQFNSAGRNTMQGFVNGMASQRGNVTSTANSLVKAVKDAFVKGLGIHSPSQYMTWVGRNTGLGLIKGLQSTQLGKFAKNTVGEMKSAFAKSKFSAEANVNYMDDDSMKEVHWMRKYDGGSVVKGADGGKGNRFVSHMLGLVNNDKHGYSQARRWGPDYDCSSSIIASLRAAGFNTGNASTTHNMSSELTKHGWMRLPYKNPKKGDILLNDATHTEMSLGNGKTAGFHSSHGHPEPGDQAHEAYVGRDPGRWAAILRYKHGFGDSLADAIEEAYNFKKYGFGSLDAEGDGGDLGGAGEKVTGKLADWIKSALKATHQPQSLLAGLIRAAKAESGGNPRAVNNWDINAKLGHPSKGLFQTIDSTFQAYKLKGHGNIYNPIDNAIAAIRYMIARYGSVENVLRPRAKRWYGYAVGSRYITHDQFAQLHEGEAVIRANENPYKNSKGGFITPILEKIVLAEMSRIASRAAAGVSGGSGGSSTDDHPVEITQKIYFQETPKQPSEFRAELRQAGRRLAFG